jgi:tetratricopeptide (TPR) repeat protein
MRTTTIRLNKFFVSSACALYCATTVTATETLAPELKQAWQLIYGSPQDISLAQKEAAAALKKNGNSAEWHELLGMAYANTAAQAALAEAQKAVSLKPTSARIMTSCAVVSLYTGVLPQAVNLATQALKLDPQNGRAYAVLGTYSYLTAKTSEAQKLFAKALQLSPNDFDVNELAAVFYAKTLQQKETRACVERLVAKFPSSSKAHGLLAKWKTDSNDPAGAAKELEIAAKLDPQSSYACSKLSKALAQMGKYKEAAAACTRLVEISPTRTAYFLRAGYFEDAGQFQKALDDYNKVIAFPKPPPGDANPVGDNSFRLREYKHCLIKRMELHEKLGQMEIALAEASEMLKNDPKSDTVLDFRQGVLRKHGRYLEALTDLNSLIQMDADVADWYKARADVYAKLKKPELAAADLAKAKHVEAFGK